MKNPKTKIVTYIVIAGAIVTLVCIYMNRQSTMNSVYENAAAASTQTAIETEQAAVQKISDSLQQNH